MEKMNLKTAAKWIFWIAAVAVVASHMGVGGFLNKLADLLPTWSGK